MGVFLKPNQAAAHVRAIDGRALREAGVRLVFCDLDNTLTRWNDNAIPAQARAFAARLRALGMDLVIVSNNNEERIRPFARALDIPFVARAKKPLPFALYRYMSRRGIRPAQAAMVGDQLLTDMLAGNLAGVYTVLVRPLDTSSEFTGTRINRFFERLIFRFMRIDWREAA